MRQPRGVAGWRGGRVAGGPERGDAAMGALAVEEDGSISPNLSRAPLMKKEKEAVARKEAAVPRSLLRAFILFDCHARAHQGPHGRRAPASGLACMHACTVRES